MTSVLLGIVAVAAIGLGFFSYWEHIIISQHAKQPKTTGRISWLDFFAKGKDAGFSNTEVRLLYDLARRSNMEHPAALFWSHVQMDACIRYIIQRYLAAGTFSADENKTFLNKLFEFRKKMELEKPRWKSGIQKTTELSEMQRIQIVVGRHGTFKSKVIENNNEVLTVERPTGSILPLNFKWKGQRVQVYLWRKDDAAYCFETVVAEELFVSPMPVITLFHTEKLERTQKRSNIRVLTNKPARLFKLGNDSEIQDEDEEAASAPVNCCMKDLSDTGCAVQVEGEAKDYSRLLLQFNIISMPVNLVGNVNSIEYNETDNTSILHIEADIMPAEIRNLIRCVVFGIIDEDIEIIPTESGAEQSATQAEAALSASLPEQY